MIKEILASCSELPNVSTEAAEAYALSTNILLDHVNNQMEANPKISELIGRNPLDIMRNNR